MTTATLPQTTPPPVTPTGQNMLLAAGYNSGDPTRKAAATAAGYTPPTATIPPPVATSSIAGTSPTESAKTPQQQTIDTATQNRDLQAQQQYDAYTNFSNTITGLQNGSIPLNQGEQAQISALQQSYNTAIAQQQLQNKNASGVANIRGYQTGAAEYDPTFQAKTIGSIVSAGAAKVLAYQVEEAGKVAELTQAFHDKDIAAVKTAYDAYVSASDKRQEAFQKTIDETNAVVKDARDYQMAVDKFNETKSQNAFDQAFKIEQEQFDEKYKTKQLALETYKAGLGAGGGGLPGVTQSATIGPNGSPDAASQQAVLAQIAGTYGPMTAIAIKGLSDYSINPMDWSSRAAKGMTREQAVTLAKMVDPTYNDAMYATRAGYMKNLASAQSGTIGGAINAANKSINHLTAFVNDVSQLGNKASSNINWAVNALTIEPGRRQTLSAAKTEGLGVAEELAKFFKGSGTVDVASIDAWKNRVSENASPGDVQGLTQGAVTLLAGQLETLSEQYKATMGKAPENNFLGPSAMANLSNLKNQGYQVDIPGVLYTDKAAYLASDPSAQANMSAAVTALTNAGLPVTPENILQAAQSL